MSLTATAVCEQCIDELKLVNQYAKLFVSDNYEE